MIAFESGRLSEIAADEPERQKLPPKLFYDQQGSVLFEQITCLPEYYPTRTEVARLKTYTDEIGSETG
ncbi:MAG: L-histidine N(alpha)-methyltransferase [Sulfuriferula sp.]